MAIPRRSAKYDPAFHFLSALIFECFCWVAGVLHPGSQREPLPKSRRSAKMKIRQSYILASGITGGLLAPNAFVDFGLLKALLIICVIVLLCIPWFLRDKSPLMMLSVVLLSSFFAGISIVVAGIYSHMLITADTLSDFEGSRGEGSPLAIIFEIGLFFLVFLLPWMIACIRSIRDITVTFKKK